MGMIEEGSGCLSDVGAQGSFYRWPSLRQAWRNSVGTLMK